VTGTTTNHMLTMNSLHREAEVFDFRNKWALVLPHLAHPKVRKALVKGMRRFCETERARLLSEGYRPGQIRDIRYNPTKGPWFYTPDDRWLHRARHGVELAMDRGEFSCTCSNPDSLPPAEKAKYDQFEARFLPRPDSYYWYQCFGACHWLAPWLKELGKCSFPQLSWKILHGERHSLAVGLAQSRIRLIFDILTFDRLSAIEMLEFVNRGEEPSGRCVPFSSTGMNFTALAQNTTGQSAKEVALNE